jgi:hypothetical protein
VVLLLLWGVVELGDDEKKRKKGCRCARARSRASEGAPFGSLAAGGQIRQTKRPKAGRQSVLISKSKANPLRIKAGATKRKREAPPPPPPDTRTDRRREELEGAEGVVVLCFVFLVKWWGVGARGVVFVLKKREQART